MKIKYLSFLFLSLILLGPMTSSSHSIDSLADSYFSQNRPIVHNPDRILSQEIVAQFERDIRVKLGDHFVLFCVVESIDFKGLDGRSVNFDMWVEQYVRKILDKKENFDSNLMLFYSIKDRKWRLRTGEKVMKTFRDSTLDTIANSLKSDLRKNNYDRAFIDLIDKISHKEDYEGWQTVHTIILAVFLIFIGMMIYSHWKDSKEKKIRKIFKTFKEIEKEGKDFKMFTQESCVICLEKLHNGKKDQVPNIDKSAFQKEVNDERRRIVESEPSEENTHQEIIEDTESVYLPCGHNFHKQCIEATLKVAKKCPICRNEVQIRDFSSFREPFLNFHRTAHGRIFAASDIDALFLNPFRDYSSSTYSRTEHVSYEGSSSGGSSGGW